MSWRDVARKEIADAGRSRAIWLVSAVLLASFAGYAVLHDQVGEAAFLPFLDGLTGVVGSTVPVLGILLGYKSVVHERTSGSLSLSLSFPLSRRDLLLGKVVGRSTVLLAPTVLALAVAWVVGAVRYGADGALLFPWFLLVTALYGLTFVALGIGLSTSTTVDRWITFGALGGYLLLVLSWGTVHSLTLLVLHRFDTTVLADLPDWSLLFKLLAPPEAFSRLVRAGFEVDRAALYVADGAPAYVDWWAALLLLVAWITVPLAVGFHRFGSADL